MKCSENPSNGYVPWNGQGNVIRNVPGRMAPVLLRSLIALLHRRGCYTTNLTDDRTLKQRRPVCNTVNQMDTITTTKTSTVRVTVKGI